MILGKMDKYYGIRFDLGRVKHNQKVDWSKGLLMVDSTDVIPPCWPLEYIGFICKYCVYVMYDS